MVRHLAKMVVLVQSQILKLSHDVKGVLYVISLAMRPRVVVDVS